MRILDILFVVVFIGNSLNKLGGLVSNVYMAVFIRSKSLRLPFLLLSHRRVGHQTVRKATAKQRIIYDR